MKLGVSYNLFDTEELLEASIKSIREETNHINVVFQKISNKGQNCSEYLLPILDRLVEEKLIDQLFEYTPDLTKTEHFNETKKRNIGLKIAKKNKCTHFLSMDSDEFYDVKQLQEAKTIISKNKYDITAVRLTNYFKKPIYEMIYQNQPEYYVSFIFKIKRFKKFKYNINYPVKVDPTRRVRGNKFILFDRKVIQMHHMTLVRKNISSKLTNSSANGVYKNNNIEFYVDYFNNWKEGNPVYPPSNYKNLVKIKKVKNKFNIPI